MNIRNKIAILALLTGAFFNQSVSSTNADDLLISMVYDIDCEDLDKTSAFTSTDCCVPIYDSMVPQGLASVGDLFLISSYDYEKESKSCINVLDTYGNLVNTCYLENKAHVGGIAFDNSNSLVWVTGIDGTVNAYDVNDVLLLENVYPKYSSMNVGKGLINYQNPFINSASFLTIKGDELIVGNFSLRINGRIKRYKISTDIDNNLILEYKGFSYIPDRVQGVTFYTLGDKEYILFSRSYGTKMASLLQVYSYDENIIDYNSCVSVSLELPAMMEQVIIKDSKMVALFESSALPYKNKVSTSQDKLIDIEIDSIIKKLEFKKDTK